MKWIVLFKIVQVAVIGPNREMIMPAREQETALVFQSKSEAVSFVDELVKTQTSQYKFKVSGLYEAKDLKLDK